MVLVAVPHLVSIWMDFTFADGLLFSFGLWAHFLINDTKGIFDPKKDFILNVTNTQLCSMLHYAFLFSSI